jgi:tRNA1Val (adenine37-N6)-methyltransferase
MTGIDYPDITRDFFYKKKVIVSQRKKGYRFSIDAPILADFLPFHPTQKALEIGTGAGIVALLALYKKKFSSILSLEIQSNLSHLAKLNAEENGFTRNMIVMNADFNEVYRDFIGIRNIFSNPPFFEIGRGRVSPNPELRDAKTETKLTLRQLLTQSFSILGKKGGLYLVLPYSRYDEIIGLAAKTGYSIAKIRLIFSFQGGKPERFLIQLTNYDVSPLNPDPLIIFKEKGVFTEEMDMILTG